MASSGLFYIGPSCFYRHCIVLLYGLIRYSICLTVPPSLLTNPSDQIVLEGANVTFHCSATGNPTPEMNWTKDGKTVAKGDTLSFEASREDAGKYWCSIDNGLSDAVNASAVLDVQCKHILLGDPRTSVIGPL